MNQNNSNSILLCFATYFVYIWEKAVRREYNLRTTYLWYRVWYGIAQTAAVYIIIPWYFHQSPPSRKILMKVLRTSIRFFVSWRTRYHIPVQHHCDFFYDPYSIQQRGGLIFWLTAIKSGLELQTTTVSRIIKYKSTTSANGGNCAGQYPCDRWVDNLGPTLWVRIICFFI